MLSMVAIAVIGCGSSPPVDEAPAVQPSMYRISNQMLALDRAIEVTEPTARQLGVVGALERIESITRELATPELRRSHALMETEIDAFFAEIVKARGAAAADPPNYYWAGRLHATCIRCHDPKGGIWKR
jgi:hypothetical protein